MPRRLSVLLAAVVLAGCMEQNKPNPIPRGQSLYFQLGGEEKLREVVDRFAERAGRAANVPDAVAAALSGPDREVVKRRLVEQLAAKLGGPFESAGPTPLDGAFRGRVTLDEADRKALAAHLDAALGECKIGERTLAEVRKALGGG